MTPDMARAIHRLRDAGALGRRASMGSRALGMTVVATLALAGCNMGGRPQGQTTTPPPQPTVVAAPADVPSGTYVVVGGDTVHAVANRFGVPIRSLIELNNLQPPYQLAPGQTLQIPTQRVHIVAEGDTISEIAQEYGVDVSTLVRQNNIAEPYTIYVGQTLVLPGQIEPVAIASAPIVTETLAPLPSSGSITSAELPPPIDPAATATVPDVEPSAGVPTPTVVAPTPSTSTAGLEPPPVLLPGVPSSSTASSSTSSSSTSAAAPPPAKPGSNEPFDVTEMTNDTTVLTPPNDATAPSTSTVTPPPTEPTATPSVPVETVAPAAATEAAPSETQEAAVDPMLIEPAARGDQTFLWPVTGKVVSEFGPLSDGLHNDGINIAAPRGTPVRAAENGVVVYAGNELRGFGNMLLIRHADGFVTAYAHNESLLVARGDTVERGQIIARVGSSGNVDSPQLHFEIRVGTDAVDPREYLGSSGA